MHASNPETFRFQKQIQPTLGLNPGPADNAKMAIG